MKSQHRYRPFLLVPSEFQKMDGGLREAAISIWTHLNLCATLATTYTHCKNVWKYICVYGRDLKRFYILHQWELGRECRGEVWSRGHHPKDYIGLAWTPGMHRCYRKGYCAGSLSNRKESILVQGVLYVLPARKCVFGSVLFIYTSITAGRV